LENAVSDREFVLAMASPDQRKFFTSMESRNAIQFENGGGISDMRNRVANILSMDGARHRLWVMFDCDARQPGLHSKDAELLSDICASGRVSFHRLERRAIENYITEASLERWSFSPPHDEKKRIKRAFCRMNSVQKFHYNMKSGFSQDARAKDNAAGSLYDTVSGNDKITLDRGFDVKIAELFKTDLAIYSDIANDKTYSEIHEMISNLVRMAR
jgi:hypothetical protein